MTAYPAWTPAARPGIIPLRPLTFGTILGRSFAALRQNPRVLLGFALVVETVVLFVVTAAIVGIMLMLFSRLNTLEPGTDDFDTVMAGSIGLTVAAAFVLTLAGTALTVLVQGVVVSEVAHAAIAERLTLRALWRRVRPVAWRLIGYTMLITVAVLVVIALAAAGVVAVMTASTVGGIVMGVALALAAIPVSLWLTIKLLLVPAVIVLEQAPIFRAVSRSWRLTRRRFWATLGVYLIISIIFAVVGQVLSLPFSFLTTGLTTVFAPTGDPGTGEIVTLVVGGVLTQVVAVLIQAISAIVLSTASSLVYIDCRMRHEGLDLDLLAYVERRDAGATDLPDPYRQNVGRTIAPRPAYAAYPPPPYPAPPGDPSAAGYPPFPGTHGQQQTPGYPPFPGATAAPAGWVPPEPGAVQEQPSAVPQQSGAVPPQQATPQQPMPPQAPQHQTPSQDATQWTAPGADGTDPESPWGRS
jgi:membrane-anchored glycerophosphoryl diester phosphodiesterase (GDPDase)